jgi:hypothetical protein
VPHQPPESAPGYVLTRVQPTDLVNQSIPLSYLGVEVASNDGNPHQVELFTDIDGEWLAQPDQFVQWNTTVGDVVTHQFSLQNQTQFGEVNGRLRYGSIVYSTEQVRYPLVYSPASLCQHVPGPRIDVPSWRGWCRQACIPNDWRFKQLGGSTISRDPEQLANCRVRP